MALPTFIWGNGGARLTPEQVAREREIAGALIKGGIDTSPVGHWTQGAARVAQALAGNIREGRAAGAEAAGRDEWQKQFNSAFGIGGDTPAVVADPSAPVSLTAPAVGGDQMPVWQNAIAGIESGGKYDAVGPTHPKMGRALGKYQVMESNVGPWAQAALGRTVTPDEFLASPEIQDAVFKNQFGQYVNQYGGDATKAAQAWFAGPGGVGTNRADVLGTTVPQYAQKFASAVGGASPVAASLANAAPAPQQQQIPLRNLMGLATSPWAPAGAQGVIQALVQQQMQQSDPMRQLQMQKLQREINAPVKRNTITIDGRLVDADTGAVIKDFGQRPTGNIQEYEYYAKGARDGGQQPLPYDQWDVARRKSGATNISNVVGGESLTPGQKKIDESFATDYLAWRQSGASDTRKQIEQLGSALDILDKNKGVTGAIGLLPQQMQAFVNPDGTVAREYVEEVVQRSLRPILGSQFTREEGERVIARAFNPLLSAEENAKRSRRLLGTLQDMAIAKDSMADYFDKNGTLRGYKGAQVDRSKLDDLEREWGRADKKTGPATAPAAPVGGAPAAGTVMDGYRFKGGNPADRNNWERAQ